MAAILIIDDDPNLVNIYQTAFEAAGHQVASASNGQQGLNYALDGGYAAILLDLKMPTMDGLQFLASYHQHTPHNPNGPILILSNMDHPFAQKEALRRGAKTFIHKDKFEPKQVVQFVAQQIKQANAQRQNTTTPHSDVPSGTSNQTTTNANQPNVS